MFYAYEMIGNSTFLSATMSKQRETGAETCEICYRSQLLKSENSCDLLKISANP